MQSTTWITWAAWILAKISFYFLNLNKEKSQKYVNSDLKKEISAIIINLSTFFFFIFV